MATINKPYLAVGQIMHKRFWPKQNKFNYKSSYIVFPVKALDSLKRKFFSIDKFNLLCLVQKDYGDGKDFIGWIENILKSNNITNVENIVLVTHPRTFGYVFNPVSFWLCFDKNDNLIAVLNEVNNTCGQKHSYLCFKKDLKPIDANEWLDAEKVFYVSPFMKIEGEYKFRFEVQDQQLSIYINYHVDGKLKLSTYLKCNLSEFSNRNIILRFLKMPFATFKTIILIHYQAVKLLLKSVKFYKCPKVLKNNLTISVK